VVNRDDLTVKELVEAKTKIEMDLLKEIRRKIEEFHDKTGAQIYRIDTEFINTEALGVGERNDIVDVRVAFEI